MTAVTKDQTPSIKSVTIIRQDVIPQGGPAVQAAARQARFLASVALLVSPVPSPDKVRADAAESQTHTFEVDVTDNPVQDGTTITDHSRRLPDVFEATCVLTDTPLFPPTPIQINRAQREWTKLLQFLEDREPVFIATSIRVYPSMILRRLQVTRDVNTGGIIRVGISARQIRIASSPVEIPLVLEAAAEAGAGGNVNGGTQSASPA